MVCLHCASAIHHVMIIDMRLDLKASIINMASECLNPTGNYISRNFLVASESREYMR